MSKIADRFATLKNKGERALVCFVTAGDPDLESLPAILSALAEGGADIIEIGIPFSDPIADGPTIQASSQRALDRGVTPRAVLDKLSECDPGVPVVLMGYANPIYRVGVEQFASMAKDAGASGSIISDLTPEESDSWLSASKEHGLDTIFLAAPTSTDARLREVCSRSSGFVYAVSRTGVTGSAESVPSDVASLVERIRDLTDVPVCVGFGIRTPEHVRAVCEVADGAVVGSLLVEQLAKSWDHGKGASELTKIVAGLKAATR